MNREIDETQSTPGEKLHLEQHKLYYREIYNVQKIHWTSTSSSREDVLKIATQIQWKPSTEDVLFIPLDHT